MLLLLKNMEDGEDGMRSRRQDLERHIVVSRSLCDSCVSCLS